MGRLVILDTILGYKMELYIQPNLTTFPTTSTLTGDMIRASLAWSANATPEQIVSAGYIQLSEPSTTQPDDTVMVVNSDYTTAWMLTAEYEAIVNLRINSSAARARRNMLLSQSDWTQGKDIPDNISTPWAVYRQALRDITSQSGFPQSIEWPTPPQQ